MLGDQGDDDVPLVPPTEDRTERARQLESTPPWITRMPRLSFDSDVTSLDVRAYDMDG